MKNIFWFNAEASLSSANSAINHNHKLSEEATGLVTPQMRSVFNCSGGSRFRRQCDAVCSLIGGGMSTESDGSITCNV